MGAPGKGTTVTQAASAPPAGAPAGNAKSAGRPSELPAGFADAVIAAVRAQEGGRSDPLVAAAFSLGWYTAALGHPAEVMASAAAERGELLGVAALTHGEALDFCRSQVEVAFARLKGVIEAAGLSLDELERMRGCLAEVADEARAKAVVEFGSKALALLSAAEFRLGKAFGVGRGLMALTTRASAGVSVERQLTPAAVAALAAAIDDLSSALPPHAGHSVRRSLEEWSETVSDKKTPSEDETWRLLARQGELWRALLSGEKSGPDMLEIDDYLDAAARMSKRMRVVAGRFLRQFWWLAALVVLLFTGGIALMVATDAGATTAAGAGGVLASLGLTWRGVGGALGGLAGKLEQPLWGAELDNAITQAITLLPREKGRDVSQRRRAIAHTLGELRGA